MNIENDNTGMLLKLMTASTMRARVIASNLSNQNTPGFKRQDVKFEELLQARMVRGGGKLDAVQPEVVTDYETEAGTDGNNVNMELEMNAMRENRILYETYASILTYKLSLIRSSIQERA